MITKRFLILLVGLLISTITFAQESIEDKIIQAFELYKSEKVNESYLLAQEINLEFEKDTIGLASYKEDIYMLNAIINRELRQYSNAIAYYLKLIPVQKKEKGETHLKYLITLGNIALLYSNLGQYQKALEFNLEVTNERKRLLGEDHPDYLISLNNLALDYLNLGQLDKALDINLKIVDKGKEILGAKIIEKNNLIIK